MVSKGTYISENKKRPEVDKKELMDRMASMATTKTDCKRGFITENEKIKKSSKERTNE